MIYYSETFSDFMISLPNLSSFSWGTIQICKGHLSLYLSISGSMCLSTHQIRQLTHEENILTKKIALHFWMILIKFRSLLFIILPVSISVYVSASTEDKGSYHYSTKESFERIPVSTTYITTGVLPIIRWASSQLPTLTSRRLSWVGFPTSPVPTLGGHPSRFLLLREQLG